MVQKFVHLKVEAWQMNVFDKGVEFSRGVEVRKGKVCYRNKTV